MIIEMFPQEIIELNKELCSGFHPELEAKLAKIAVADIDLKLAEIGAYCGLILDGYYSFQERMDLCGALVSCLKLMRKEKPAVIIS